LGLATNKEHEGGYLDINVLPVKNHLEKGEDKAYKKKKSACDITGEARRSN